ncbi:TonB-dependent receptor [Aureitalea marina]|uniref:TonB-dependent receptor n=1 Tax=Aureitalea marina TaxID=930804 RepID=UPI0015E3BC1B|nr:TonB-dependent receptor [Aureitalea marina]
MLPLFIGSSLLAQEEQDLGTEVVNVVKPYTPSVSDAFKVRETPLLDDSVTTRKKDVRYEIFSVPVASTFTPAKGQAATVEKSEPMKLYDSYASLGFGNYTSVLAELFSNFQISRTDNAGIFFRHNSSQGDIDDVLLENKFYDTKLDGNYISRQRDLAYEVNAGVQHQLFNWYGLNPLFNEAEMGVVDAIDPQQTYFSAYAGGEVQMDESTFQEARGKLSILTDAFSSSEFRGELGVGFDFPVDDFSINLQGDLDFLSGGFDRDYANLMKLDYSYLITGITPAFNYTEDDFTVSLGAAVVFGFDLKNSSTDFYVYPRINASYRLVDEVLIAYGGADGGLRQNSYDQFRQENPFVSPTLWIAPTNEQYDAFLGLKGKASNTVGYNLRVSYGSQENRALFQANPYKGMSVNFEGYENGNSFGIVYDDIRTLSVFGELKVEISDNFSLGLNGSFYQYDLTNQAEPWNLPDFEASLYSNFNITEQIYGGVSFFFVGERKDLFMNETTPLLPPTLMSLDSYFDLNAHVGYRVNDRFNIFLNGSNLTGQNYQKWMNFPVQRIQALLGATYKFDW